VIVQLRCTAFVQSKKTSSLFISFHATEVSIVFQSVDNHNVALTNLI